MAKFRSNYRKTSNSRIAGIFIRVVIGLAVVMIFLLAWWLRETPVPYKGESVEVIPMEVFADYLPVGGNGELIKHPFFTISYNEEHEQANWVAYELTREQLKRKRVERSKYFFADSLVSSGTAEWYDYRESIYSRGHLVPAADRGWDSAVMQSTFLMSNISPQVEQFNGGVWREAEELVREWAIDKEHIYVVSGPVFRGCSLDIIGQKNKITVPCSFFKAILYLDTKGEGQSVGFIIPHQKSEKPLSEFMVTIDSLESYLALDFFPGLAINEKYNEAVFNPEFWPVNMQRYKLRINQWNKQRK